MKDEDKLDEALVGLGNAVANLVEQVIKGQFVDEHGHMLTQNRRLHELSDAMYATMAVRKELKRPGT